MSGISISDETSGLAHLVIIEVGRTAYPPGAVKFILFPPKAIHKLAATC